MKTIKMTLMVLVFILVLGGCHKLEKAAKPKEEPAFHIGVLVGAGGIGDQSFNQQAWEGITKYTDRHHNVRAQMVVADGKTVEDHLKAAEELIAAKANVIIGLGPEFSGAIEKLQKEHPKISYILVDGKLDEIETNTVVVTYAAAEVGFAAGAIASLQSARGKVGFIGGKDTPSSKPYEEGFKEGVAHANKEYGKRTEIGNFQYCGSLSDIKKGEQLAKEMYDSGTDIIFVCAGAAGIGALNEAKVRLEKGEHVYIISADRDQFKDGKLTDGKSVVLTSVIKHVDQTLYELLEAYGNGAFPGGERLQKNFKNEGLSLPKENKNFHHETKVHVEEVVEHLKSGKVKGQHHES